MITSEIIKIKFTDDYYKIENELKKMNIIPIRWAVISVDNDLLTLSVSYEK